MEKNRILKFAAACAITLLTTRAQALSYTVSSFAFPDVGGGNTYATGINDSGTVVGWFSPAYSTNGLGFTYDGNSFSLVNAPDSSGAYGGTFARDISAGGLVSGSYYSTTSHTDIGFIYGAGTYTPIDASSLNSNRTTITTTSGVNDNRQVIGSFADYSTGIGNSFLYDNGQLSLVVAPGAVSTAVSGINNSGVIVGSLTDSANLSHGYIFNGNTFSVVDAPGSSNTVLLSISNNGQILGRYNDASGAHNFVLNNGVYESIDFSSLEASSTILYGVNNAGQIVGTAYGGKNGAYGFVLNPVPLPAAAWLYGSGVLGLSGLRQLKRRQRALTNK
jgi:hypothetical protein